VLEFASRIADKRAKVRVYIYNLEDEMTKSQYTRFSRKGSWLIAGILFLGAMWQLSVSLQAQSPTSPLNESDALLDSYRHVEVASVSDALEQLSGRKMYLSHKMQSIFPAKFVGFALTVKLSKDEGNKDPAALGGMLAAIDQGTRNSVWVMVVEDGADIAGMGGLMGTAMAARGYSGAVIDGGVRDVGQLRKIGFPVYATGIVPSTSVSHYRFAGAEIPVTCDGVEVNPGDIVAADGDGVVIVPRAKAKEVLAIAQEMDFKEHSMYSIIEKYKSIQEAVKRFGRL
jgi:regulator of RNase E activity RraA